MAPKKRSRLFPFENSSHHAPAQDEDDSSDPLPPLRELLKIQNYPNPSPLTLLSNFSKGRNDSEESKEDGNENDNRLVSVHQVNLDVAETRVALSVTIMTIIIEGHACSTWILGKVILGSGYHTYKSCIYSLWLHDYWYCTTFTIYMHTLCILITIREQLHTVHTYVRGTYMYGTLI